MNNIIQVLVVTYINRIISIATKVLVVVVQRICISFIYIGKKLWAVSIVVTRTIVEVVKVVVRIMLYLMSTVLFWGCIIYWTIHYSNTLFSTMYKPLCKWWYTLCYVLNILIEYSF